MNTLDALIEYSRRYGADPALVNAGGGNTSAKENGIMYVKCSGTALAQASADSFARMDMSALNSTLTKKYPDTDKEREAAFLADMMAARCAGEENKRPSVETLLHALFPQKFVLHLHPALVNGLTCSKGTETLAREILGEDVVWIPACRPGYILAMLMYEKFCAANGKINVVLLENHGVFFAADTVDELDRLLSDMMAKLMARVTDKPEVKIEAADEQGTALAKLGGFDFCFKVGGKSPLEFAASREAATDMMTPFDPDQVVYCGAGAEFVDDITKAEKINRKVVILKNSGIYAMGNTEKQATNAALLTADSVNIAVYTRAFGGASHLSAELVDFLVNWEAESYRQKV